MNGRRHALTGVVAGVATAPFAALVGLPHAAWAAAAIAGSIVPDVDHPACFRRIDAECGTG